MGRRGPPAKPERFKVIEGTFRQDRQARNAPQPEVGIPDMPERLTPRARAAWDRIAPELERLGVLTVVDGPALELLCDAYAEWADLRDQVEREGATYVSETRGGKTSVKKAPSKTAAAGGLLPARGKAGPVTVIIRAHPAARLAADAWRRVHRMLLEFGLTPAARTRVSSQGGEAGGRDPWQDLVRGA